jgi:hypothetical protein
MSVVTAAHSDLAWPGNENDHRVNVVELADSHMFAFEARDHVDAEDVAHTRWFVQALDRFCEGFGQKIRAVSCAPQLFTRQESSERLPRNLRTKHLEPFWWRISARRSMVAEMGVSIHAGRSRSPRLAFLVIRCHSCSDSDQKPKGTKFLRRIKLWNITCGETQLLAGRHRDVHALRR